MAVEIAPKVKLSVAALGLFPYRVFLQPADNHGQIKIKVGKNLYGPFLVSDFDAAFEEVHKERNQKSVVPHATVPAQPTRRYSTWASSPANITASKRPGYQVIKIDGDPFVVHPGKFIAAARKANSLR